MKQKIKFSTFSLIITIGVLILAVAGIYSLWDNEGKLITLCVIMGITIIAGLYFCPKYIEANDSEIILHRLLGTAIVINYDDIQKVDTCYPSGGGLRLCASGGFFGYWGIFSDISIGTYIGYYGNPSNCILVNSKDGKQYVFGCENPDAMVDYIIDKMNK